MCLNSVMKKLMWIQGFLPEGVNRKIIDLCNRNNDLELSDRFLIYPLHISLKRTFIYDDFEKIYETVEEVLKRHKGFEIRDLKPFRVENMLWLTFEYDEELLQIHEDLDRTLSEKHGIAIDEFDLKYLPHISLFHDEDETKLDMMADRLSSITDEIFVVNKVAVGSKDRENRLIRLK